MFTAQQLTATTKEGMYCELERQVRALLEGEREFIASAANFASLLFHTLPGLNWAGFYLLRGGELVLGPFQGKPACVRIKPGSGVCGASAERCETVVVENVHEFPGHIACDSASNSEIVIPLVKYSELIGVLDLDSVETGRFTTEDKVGLERLAQIFLDSTDMPCR